MCMQKQLLKEEAMNLRKVERFRGGKRGEKCGHCIIISKIKKSLSKKKEGLTLMVAVH